MSLLDNASLIVTPNGYKEGKLYSVIPSDGSGDMSVTRATTATRVNSQGLVELVPYNYIRYSEDFTNGNWIKLGTALTVTANSTIAPNGTLTADTLNVSNNDNILYQSAISGFAFTGNTYTFSIYAKGSGTFAMNIRLNSATITTQTKTLTSEWQRFDVSVTNSVAVTSIEAYMQLNTSSTYYVWGAQVVEGSVAKDYQKTETRLNIPRLDYSNGTCPSLLVEPQRTNLLTWSSSFDNAAWSKYGLPTLTGGVLSPDGTNNAFELTMDVSEGIYQNATNTAGTYACSIWIKGDTNGVIGLVDGNSPIITQTINVSTEWKQVSVNLTKTAAPLQYAIYRLNSSYLSKVYIYAAQCELGTYPTSYIPTTSASVTRNADNIELLNSAILPTSYPFTMFVDAKYSSLLAFFPLSFLNTASNSNYFAIRFEAGRVDALIRPNTTEIGLLSPSIFTEGQAVRVAVKVESGTIKLFVNGQLQASATNTVLFNAAINDLFIGRLRSSFDTNTRLGLNAAVIWNTALTDTECQTLTTV